MVLDVVLHLPSLPLSRSSSKQMKRVFDFPFLDGGLIDHSTFTSHYVQTISNIDGAQMLFHLTWSFSCIFLVQCVLTLEKLQEDKFEHIHSGHVHKNLS